MSDDEGIEGDLALVELDQEITMSTVGTDEQLVSVVIPTYYRNDHLEAVIQSVLAQRYEPIEIIVVDDSGESHARPVVEEFDGLTYIPNEVNEGPQIARTIGIQQSRGGFVQILDDDDRLLRDKIRRQVELLNQSPDVGVAYCGFRWENGTTVLPKAHVRGDVLEETLTFDTAPCITSTMLIRKDIIDQCLPLTDRPGADDTGLKIELAKRTLFDYDDEALVVRSELPDSRQASTGKVRGQKQIIEEYQELYDRFPERVYRTAVAETYLISGLSRLDEHLWSPSAIVALMKACYYIPGLPLPFVGAFAASLFGKPGRDLGLRVLQAMRGDNRRGKSF